MVPLQAALAEKVGAESPGRNNISQVSKEWMPTSNVVFECILLCRIEQTNTKYNKKEHSWKYWVDCSSPHSGKSYKFYHSSMYIV